MAAIVSLLVIVALSLLIVRTGTTALVMTGLTWEVASFQAYSAFFGVGFTTREAELVVSDPARRRIIKHLILAGNVGITAGVGSVIVAFVGADGPVGQGRVLLVILAGLAALGLVSVTPPVRRAVDWAIRRSLRAAGVVRPADFALLLRLHAGYVVEEVEIHAGSSIAGRSLRETRLGSAGVLVLGCTRAGADGHPTYLGAPDGSFRVEPGDLLTVYGKQALIGEVMRRGTAAVQR